MFRACAVRTRVCVVAYVAFSGEAPGAIPPLRGVGLANLIDLYDGASPCGSVHIRNKTVVGERLALAVCVLKPGFYATARCCTTVGNKVASLLGQSDPFLLSRL